MAEEKMTAKGKMARSKESGSKTGSVEQEPKQEQQKPPSKVDKMIKSKFDSTVDSIKDNVQALSVATKMIEQINDNLETEAASMSEEELTELTRRVSQAVKAANLKAKDTGRLVHVLRDELSTQQQQNTGAAVGKRELECKSVTKAFTDQLLMYQSAQQDFRNELKARLRRQLASVMSEANEDFIDVSIRSESRRSQVYRDIMAGDLDLGDKMSDEKAKAFKEDVREKYSAVMEFTQGSSELNKVFLGVASTVAESSDEEFEAKPAVKELPKSISSSNPETKKRRRWFSFLRRGRRDSSRSPSPEKPKRRGWFRGPKRKRSRIAAMMIMATVALAAVMGVHMVLLKP